MRKELGSPWTNLPRQVRRCILAQPLRSDAHTVMYALQYVIHGLQCSRLSHGLLIRRGYYIREIKRRLSVPVIVDARV